MKRQRDGKKAERREKILDGAMRTFLTQGYSASMDEIARESGVVKQTLYSYYKDKKELFSALIDRLLNRFRSSGMSSEVMDLPPEAFFRRVTDLSCARMDDWEYVAFLRLVITESTKFPELAELYFSRLSKPGLDSLSEYMKENPAIRFSDPEAVARVVHGALVHFTISQEILNGKYNAPLSRERLSNAMVELLIFAAAQSREAR